MKFLFIVIAIFLSTSSFSKECEGYRVNDKVYLKKVNQVYKVNFHTKAVIKNINCLAKKAEVKYYGMVSGVFEEKINLSDIIDKVDSAKNATQYCINLEPGQRFIFNKENPKLIFTVLDTDCVNNYAFIMLNDQAALVDFNKQIKINEEADSGILIFAGYENKFIPLNKTNPIMTFESLLNTSKQ